MNKYKTANGTIATEQELRSYYGAKFDEMLASGAFVKIEDGTELKKKVPILPMAPQQEQAPSAIPGVQPYTGSPSENTSSVSQSSQSNAIPVRPTDVPDTRQQMDQPPLGVFNQKIADPNYNALTPDEQAGTVKIKQPTPSAKYKTANGAIATEQELKGYYGAKFDEMLANGEFVKVEEEKEEADYFTGAFGDVLRGFDKISPVGIGDFVDDIARSVASGYRQGTAAQEADNLLLQGTKATPEQIQKFIDANKNAQLMGPSQEMLDYQKVYEEEGKGFWGVIKGLVKNPTVIPEVLSSSLVAMATNTDALKAGAAAIVAGAGIGAAGGTAVVPVAGTAAGALAGAQASIPYAFGLASSVVEMGSTFGELLTDELNGKEMTKENVKAILENPEKLQSIRNKAIARGAIIGTVDAFTGKLASGVGAKIIGKSAAKSATGAVTKGAITRATAAGAGIEAVGGSAGEAAARGAIGQEMDVSDIALEGLAELPGGIRSTLQARLTKPSYKVNGAKATVEQVDELINTMTPDQLQQTKIDIKNDYEGREFKIQDKIVTNSVKEQVRQGNPDLNEPSLNAITDLELQLRKLEGNTTQTGKDKAAAIRTQIKGIQENQIQEEATLETIKSEQDAIQKQTTNEGVLRTGQPEVGLQEVGKGNVQPEVTTTRTKEAIPAKVKEEVKTKEQIDAEAEKLHALLGTPSGEPKFRLAEETEKPLTTDTEVIEKEMNNMPAVELNFTEPEVSQKGLKVNPVAESNSTVKIDEKTSKDLLKPIQSFNGIPMITGMSDMLSAGKIKDSEGNEMDVEGGLLFNVLGKNKEAAWAGVNKESAQAQYDNAVKLYESNKELFDRLWSEGKLPDGHIPMAIMRMADTAVNSNEAVFRWILPTVEKFSKKNNVNAMKAFIESVKEKLNTKSEADTASAQRILDFIKEKKITSLNQFLKEIISDSNNRAKGNVESKLKLDNRSMIYDLIFAPKGIRTASKPTVKALLSGTDNSKNKLFTSDVIYSAVGEPSMLKTKQGEVVSVVGIDVKNGGVIPVEHGNYGFGPKGKTIALIENPTHGIDVFPEWKAKTSRVFKENKAGKVPSPESVAIQTGGAFFTDKAFKGSKVSVGLIDDLNLLIGKLRFAFPSVSVSTTQEEFNNIVNSPDVRTQVSNGKIILGVTKDGKIYLNPEMASLKTPIHEFGHIWIDFLRSDESGKKGTDLLDKGLELIKDTEEHKRAIEKYGNNDLALEEALVELMANKGSTIINAAKKSQFKSWLNAVFKYIQEKFITFKDLDINKISKIKLEDFINTGLADLFSGKEVSAKFAPELSDAAFKARMSAITDINEIIKIGRANGISEEAITKVLKDKNFSEQEITSAFEKPIEAAKKVQLSEEVLPGYDRMMQEVDGIIQRSRERGASNEKIKESVMNYVTKSSVYERATDVQREKLVRDVNKMFGVKEKSAPSAEKIIGDIKDVTKITMTEKQGLVKQIKDLARGAKDAKMAFMKASNLLSKEIQELVSSGKVTVKQMSSILRRFSSVNVLNEKSVEKFVGYMSNVFEDAEYANKIDIARNLLTTAKKNIGTKIGISDGLILPLQKLFSINPNLIPESVLDKYLSLVDMFGKKQAVLALDEKSEVTKTTQDILKAIEVEQSLVDELSDRFNASENRVFDEDGKLDYAASLKQMVKQEEITEDDADIMRKYKSDIIPQVEKAKMTEEEIAEEKKQLINTLKQTEVNSKDLPTQDERKLAKQLKDLASTDAIEKLNNTDLKNLLKVFDNINNNYLPHYAELMVEKLNAINDAKTLTSAVKRAVVAPISGLYSRIKAIVTRSGRTGISEMIRRNPLFYVDQLFGDFKTKDIFNSILNKVSEGESKFKADLKRVQNILEKAEERVAKSFKLNANKTLMSKFKMMTYMVQLENDSNQGSKQVNPAADYLKATIKHIDEGKSQFGQRDSDMLQEILDKYTDSNGDIDNQKLYNSFNEAEKSAIKDIRGINESLKEKAEYTAAIIRGDRINPLSNYVHLNVLHEHKPNDLTSGVAFVNDYNNSMRPSTKAKSLIERTGKVSPLNFDVFASAQRGAKFVLMDYNLTAPIRTARKTIKQTIANFEEQGRIPKEKRQIINAIDSAFEEATENVLTNSFVNNSLVDDAVDYINKQGYRAVLAGTSRFVSELISNIGFAVISDPKAFSTGVANKGFIMSADAPLVMENVNSKQTNRIFPTDTLSGKLIDTNILQQTSGIRGAKSKNPVKNKIQQIWNLSGKKYLNIVELTADALISTPDKLVMRPMWFGSFANEFKKITGEKVDFDKIASNDEKYMEQNKEAIEKAKTTADERAIMTGATDNPFMGILKGTVKPDQKFLPTAFNNFNNFMTRFLIFEYVTARTGIMAAMGNGSLSKKQGAAVLGAVTTRMVVYTLLTQMIGTGLMGLVIGGDDEEEDEKSFMQKLGQAFASTFTSMVIGRDFGNATKQMLNIGIERVNENYLDFLREGDYDPYKDAIQYSIVPPEKEGEKNDLSDLLFNMGGVFGPTLKTANFLYKKAREKEKEDDEAYDRQQQEINVRIPLEILGTLGFVPLYKDIRKAVLKDMYSGIKDAEESAADKKRVEQEKLQGYKNQEDMKRYDPKLWDETYGPNSPDYDEEQAKKNLKREKDKLEREMKDEMYDYVPKKKSKGGFGSSKFGEGQKKSKEGFGSSKFGSK